MKKQSNHYTCYGMCYCDYTLILKGILCGDWLYWSSIGYIFTSQTFQFWMSLLGEHKLENEPKEKIDDIKMIIMNKSFVWKRRQRIFFWK